MQSTLPPSGPALEPAPTNAHPLVRTYSGRRGHITIGQRQALQDLSGRFCVPFAQGPFDWPTHFGRSAPRVFEIGFGMGETTAAIASANPQRDYLGCEVYPAGVGGLLVRIGQQQLTNIRICHYDAVLVLTHMIAPDSLDAVHVYFPDPWRKKRHHKRRLIQPPLVELVRSRLKPGGYLHCATDWEDYAMQMAQVLGTAPGMRKRPDEIGLEPAAGASNDFSARPSWRPLTKFEARGLRLGHQVWDLVYERSA
jgi:tRNA (guanine-N7-)-methyltransferase